MKKLTQNDPETRSPDGVAENIQRLKTLFPELVTEGPNGAAVNVDVLKALVGDATVTDADEKYGLNWHGKRRARQLALTPSTGTLRPCPEDSVDWDTTQNLMIEGDNLEVLKLLQKSYAGKVKLIYIDPPYNTGKDFVYPDDFKDNIKNYLELTGQVEGGRKISTNTEASGRFHTDWLNMMYPRLRLARNLLRSDGVVFISIDEVEVSHLRVICCEIFGEENVLDNYPVIMNLKGNQDAYGFAETHEYFIVCFRSKNDCTLNHFPVDEEETLKHWLEDEYGLYKEADNLRATGVNAPRTKRPNLWYPVFLDESSMTFYVTEDDEPKDESHAIIWPTNPNGEELSWYWSKATFMDSRHNLILKKTTNGWQFYRKQRPQLGDLPTRKPKSVFYKPDYSSSTATNKLRDLFGRRLFEAPKPVPFIRDLLILGSGKDDLVLDFFAGSGTTGEAVYWLNAADGGARRFVLVQLPEPTPEESLARSEGYSTISELTKDRLRLVAKKIKDENPMFAGDLGFRVFKLDSSNIRAWAPDRDNLEQTLLDSMEHIKSDRTESDVLYELLLKLGLDLCVPIESRTFAGKEVHSVGGGVLMACLAPKIERAEVEALAQGIVDWHKALAPAGDTTCVFRDSAFADDVAKTNMAAILEQHGITNVRSL